MPNHFFTADTHFGHANIIKYCKRPFTCIEEHDEILIDNWNKTVGTNDIVYHAGDFGFFYNKYDRAKEVIRSLNGTIVFIPGNHDSYELQQAIKIDCIREKGIHEIKIQDDEMDGGAQRITICHYPMLAWNQSHRGAWQCFGHIHQSAKYQYLLSPNQLNVGVDCHEYRPISYDEVKTIITHQSL